MDIWETLFYVYFGIILAALFCVVFMITVSTVKEWQDRFETFLDKK